jgi:hypothetical protein
MVKFCDSFKKETLGQQDSIRRPRKIQLNDALVNIAY